MLGKAQITNPAAPNYVTARSNGEGQIDLDVRSDGFRPWKLLVTAYQSGGYLKEGEQIEIIFGDTRFGSPGMLMQTFVETGYEFRVATDVQATGNFLPLARADFSAGRCRARAPLARRSAVTAPPG